jgi:hypothetical protein
MGLSPRVFMLDIKAISIFEQLVGGDRPDEVDVAVMLAVIHLFSPNCGFP